MAIIKGKKRSRLLFLKLVALFLVSLHLAPDELCAELAPSQSNYNDSSSTVQRNEINIGVVLDMGSWTGKNVHSCITMAISDFYASNDHYKTRLVLHTRNSRGDPKHAISSALDLLENINVQALVGLETPLETKYLAALGDKAKVPIFYFSSIFSQSGAIKPYLVQINEDQTFLFKGIASILSLYKWRTVAVIYQAPEDGKYFIPGLVGSLQERSIRVSCRTALSPFSTDDQILDELHKLAVVRQTIFIVHMSPSLASRLFLTAERLGMMKEGYAWIVTDKTMNQFQSMDWEVVESSMQGVVGLKAYIPSSSKLRAFSLRWKKEFYSKNPYVEFREFDVLGVRAYDTIWALAESIETLGRGHLINTKMGNFCSGAKLLNEVARTRFKGLSGEFQILDGRLLSQVFTIVNVIGKGERRVGFWTPEVGIVKDMQHLVKGRSLSSSTAHAHRAGLDRAIIWPGITTTAPKGLLMLTSGKKLRIAVLNNEGFKQFVSVRRHNETNTTRISGFCVDVFHAAIDSLDYQVPFEFIPYVDQNGKNLGSYTELVYQVYLQNYDGIVGDITITGNRSFYVDFTGPYTDLGIGIITKRENNDIWLFLKPLHLDLWLTSAAFFIVTGFVVWVIEHSSSNQEFRGSKAYQIGTILWFGFSTLFYAHREKLTSNWSKLVVIVWLFVVLVLTSTYTATLTSMLTLQKIQLGLEEHVGSHLNSFLVGDIKSNLHFRDDRLQWYTSPEEYADALSRGSKQGGVGAIIDEIPYLKVFLGKYGADYTIIASQSVTNGFGFAFHKDYAELVSDLSRAIIKLREEEKLAMMENMWVKSQSFFMPEVDAAAATPNILNLRSFLGLFLITCGVCVVAPLMHFTSIFIQNLNEYFNSLANFEI